jgi:RNA polymerase sigma-70 factor (ECF subfamily)
MEAEAVVLQYPMVSEIRADTRVVSENDDRPASAPPPPSAAPDEGRDLIERHLSGESDAFGRLLTRYRAPVYGFFKRSGAPPEVADDLFQETFLRVHLHAASYSGARPFRVWLFTIAHNLLRSHWRKVAVRRVMVGWWAGPPGNERPREVPDPSAGPEEQATTSSAMRWLEEALARLPERHRQALVLTQIEGLSQAEAAEVLRAPVATIKTWVHRGRAALAAARRIHEGEVS